jgi:hypothetical protein
MSPGFKASNRKMSQLGFEDKGNSHHLENAYDDDPMKDTVLAPVQAGEMHRMSAEDRAAALRLAQQADPGPPIASMRTVIFTGIVLVVCMCSGDNGERLR